MVRELSYFTISRVLDSWERVRRIESYKTVLGCRLFQRLFVACPQAKVLFGFDPAMDPFYEDLLRSKQFNLHAVMLIDMIDSTLNMLGPDDELLTEVMMKLGRQHCRYGVTAEMLPLMGDSLIMAMDDCLGSEKLSEKEKMAWEETFETLVEDMTLAHKVCSQNHNSNKKI